MASFYFILEGPAHNSPKKVVHLKQFLVGDFVEIIESIDENRIGLVCKVLEVYYHHNVYVLPIDNAQEYEHRPFYIPSSKLDYWGIKTNKLSLRFLKR